MPLPSSLPVMASASVSYWDFALCAVVPLAHFQRNVLSFLAGGIRQRVFLDGRGAGPRCAGAAFGTRVIQYGSGMALSSSLAPSGNATASIDGLGGLRLVAVRTVRSGSLLARLTGLTGFPFLFKAQPGHTNAEIRASTTTSAAATTAAINLPCERGCRYQTCLSFFHSHKTRNHPLKVMESSSRNGFQRNVCATSTPPANVLSQNLRIVGDMAKTSSQFLCSECGWSGPKWLGRCPECGQWGTIEEFA